jgi:His/Glu/Gln/Arg/opine family amino acid ABC transporter permease subunit
VDLLAFGPTGWGDEMCLATLMTLAVSVCAFAIALVIGAVGTAGKLSRHRPVRLLLDVYTTVFRGIPELLIIYLIFFGGSNQCIRLRRCGHQPDQRRLPDRSHAGCGIGCSQRADRCRPGGRDE